MPAAYHVDHAKKIVFFFIRFRVTLDNLFRGCNIVAIYFQKYTVAEKTCMQHAATHVRLGKSFVFAPTQSDMAATRSSRPRNSHTCAKAARYWRTVDFESIFDLSTKSAAIASSWPHFANARL